MISRRDLLKLTAATGAALTLRPGILEALARQDLDALVDEREQVLVRELKRFADIVARAADECEPSVIAASSRLTGMVLI